VTDPVEEPVAGLVLFSVKLVDARKAKNVSERNSVPSRGHGGLGVRLRCVAR
jgi:hypothetical protein